MNITFYDTLGYEYQVTVKVTQDPMMIINITLLLPVLHVEAKQ